MVFFVAGGAAVVRWSYSCCPPARQHARAAGARCGRSARAAGASARRPRSPRRCRPITRAATRAPRRKPGSRAESGAAPGVAALLAARAAHQMREFERRDRWLERADGSGESLQAARLVSRAELALEERDFAGGARCAAQPARRRPEAYRDDAHAAARRARRAATGTRCCASRRSSPSATRSRPALAEEYKVQATVELLARSADDAARVRAPLARRCRRPTASSRASPPRPRATPPRSARPRSRASILENALAAEWSAALVALYGEPAREPRAAEDRIDEARARIERAERWLLEREPRTRSCSPRSGRLCAQAELWGKARSFLEASLSFEESRAAHLELARLAERLGQRGRGPAPLPPRRRSDLNQNQGQTTFLVNGWSSPPF